jgi:hypothetical protein
MARWYATFNNTTNSGLEAGTTANFYQRVAITNGTALQSALVSTRSALSTAVLAQLDAANRNGSLGIVVPPDVITRGANLSWTNVYTNTGAVWPSDPRVRPTAQILSTNSTLVTPSDPGTIINTLYTDAQTAVENCLTAMTGGGPRGRIGLNPYRTLASVWHDHNLTFLAWDDFTPGQVQGLTAVGLGSSGAYGVTIEWASYQYLNDENQNGKVLVQASLTQTSGGSNYYTFNSGYIQPPSSRSVLWTLSTPAPAAGTYTLEASVRVQDAVIPAHEGTQATFFQSGVVIF